MSIYKKRDGRRFRLPEDIEGPGFSTFNERTIEKVQNAYVLDKKGNIQAQINIHEQRQGVKDDPRYSGENSKLITYGNIEAYGEVYASEGILIKEGEYANWGASTGESGYGIRDNSGTIEAKNSGGQWATIGSGGGTITGVTAGTGLDGGGNSGTVTVNSDLNSLTTSTSNSDALYFIAVNASGDQKKVTKANINNSGFNNDSGFVTSAQAPVQSVNTQTGVVSLAYSNLTSGAPSASTTTQGIIEIATNVEANNTGTTSKAIVPSNYSAIDLGNFNNDQGWTSSAGTCTSVGISAGSLIDISGSPVTTSGTITVDVDLSELTDGTATINGSQDEMVYLDNGAQKRKQIDEIDLGQFNNDQGWTSATGTVTPGSTDTFTNKTFDASGTGNSISNIPNASLSNNTISGTALGSDLSTVTFQSGLTSTTYNGTGDVTIENTGVTSLVGGTGISVNQGTGTVTVTNTGAAAGGVVSYIINSTKIVLGGAVTVATVLFDSAAASNVNVVSAVNNGVFTIASTGEYKATGFVVVEADVQNRSDVSIRFKFTNGNSPNTTYTSTVIPTLSSTSVKIQIISAYFNFTDVNTRSVEMEILATAGNASDNITTINDKGYPYGLIEITKLS